MVGLLTFAIIIGLIWLEVIVFGLIGHEIGVGLTIIGVFVTAFIGIRLFRISGRSTLQRMAGAVSQGRAPLVEVADGAAIILAAVLLLIPGYFTDALGFVLFIPGLRSMIMVLILSAFRHLAPRANRQGFNFSMKHMEDVMSNDPMNSDETQDPFRKTKGRTTINDENDAANTTIEGDFKRRD